MRTLVRILPLLTLFHLAGFVDAQQNPESRGPNPSVREFGAKGDDVADDTAAVQSCIDYSAVQRASCFVPPGVYRITGSGLRILRGQPSLYGLQSMGNGSATLRYYGTDTALTIGDGTHRLFAINLTNIAVAAGNGVSARFGIDVRNISGGDWSGVTVGGGATNGTFTAGIRFSDAAGVNMRRLVVSNQRYTPGSTGLLFDKAVSYGNTNITIDVSDQANMEKMFEIRNLVTGYFNKVYVENSAYGVYMNNEKEDVRIQNVVFDEAEINTSGKGPAAYKVLALEGAGAMSVEIDQLRFSDCRFFLSGGVPNPITLHVAGGSPRYIGLSLAHNVISGAEESVVQGDSKAIKAFFEHNFVRNKTGAVRTPNFSGVGTVQDFDPEDSSGSPLAQHGPDGSLSLSGLLSADGGAVIGTGATEVHKYRTVSAQVNFPAPAAVPGCTPQIALTQPGSTGGSAPIFYSPPVAPPAGMQFSAYASPAGQIIGQWCQFSGNPADPDGQSGAVYTISILQ